MALKTEKVSVTPAEASPADVPPDPTPTRKEANTTVLELALYTLYTWQGNTYEKGKPYRFRNSDAMVLLGEQDLGRPVWRIYKPPVKRAEPRNVIVDATQVEAQPIEDDTPSFRGRQERKRIEVGTDDEIADILNRPDEGGDVTV